jgi:hypothetical protein
MQLNWAELLGWYGMGAIVLAYGLLSFGFIVGTNIWYQFLNATGAAGIAYISLQKRAYQPAILNMIWLVIAVGSLLNMLA